MSNNPPDSEPYDVREKKSRLDWAIVHRLKSGSWISLNADTKSIHESLQREREKRTKRVKSILP